MIFLGDFSFVKIFLKNYCVTMTTTLNTSRSENTMVLSARVSACMYFIVTELCFSLLFNKHTYPDNDVTHCAESATYILHIFAYNFGTR